jgi:hypothetical protein
MPEAPRIVSGSPPDVKMRYVGVSTCSAPTKRFSGAAARASTRPSSIKPFTIRTAPTYSRPTLAIWPFSLRASDQVPRVDAPTSVMDEAAGSGPDCV